MTHEELIDRAARLFKVLGATACGSIFSFT